MCIRDRVIPVYMRLYVLLHALRNLGKRLLVGLGYPENVRVISVYLPQMCIRDRQYAALYVKNVCDDPDAYDGIVFTRFYADCIGSGTPIIWEEMM